MRLQIFLDLHCWALGFRRLDPQVTSLAYIYAWTLSIGPLHIRRWAARP